MRPVILYRGRDFEENEMTPALEAGFDVTDSRMEIKYDDLVIGRYSCLPFYEEQERDLLMVNAKLINSWGQHLYIANMMAWYEDLKDFTPQTWGCAEDIPWIEDGPFFLKGATNSKKFLWNTHCVAPTRRDVGRVIANLQDDTMIGQQQICIRKLEKLVTYWHEINGLAVTQEYRFFVAYGQVVSGGYYWSNNVGDFEHYGIDVKPVLDTSQVPRALLQRVIDAVGKKAAAYTIDVGKKQDGDWIVIELNDLQMAGLSENDPNEFYSNLFTIVSRNKGVWNIQG